MMASTYHGLELPTNSMSRNEISGSRRVSTGASTFITNDTAWTRIGMPAVGSPGTGGRIGTHCPPSSIYQVNLRE